jgi:hypothetical protein
MLQDTNAKILKTYSARKIIINRMNNNTLGLKIILGQNKPVKV